MGKVIKVGDSIDTVIIIPTQYMTLRTIAEMSRYAFEPLRPEIPNIVEKGDVLIAGNNFGCGSSREQAPLIIKELGFQCVIAKSYARIFYRNALNNGLIVLESKELYDMVNENDEIHVDMNSYTARVLRGKKVHKNIRLIVTPASKDVYLKAIEKGIITDLIKSGAIITNPGCSTCFGAMNGLLAKGEKLLSTANRNFKGRVGSSDSEIYLASPVTVAVSALYGEITDPRDFEWED